MSESWSAQSDTNEIEYWRDCFSTFNRSISAQYKNLIDWTAPYGIAEGKGVRRGPDTIVDYYISVASKHPTKVILCQIGEFYELFGFGALVAIDVLSLNRMGSGQDSLRAGFPLAQLSVKITALTKAQYGVVVCNQKTISSGSTGRKSRHIAGVVTPGSPYFVHASAMAPHEDGDEFGYDVEALPYLALATRVDGFALYRAYPDKQEIHVTHALSAFAVQNILNTTRFAYPLMLLSSQSIGVEGGLEGLGKQYPTTKIMVAMGTGSQGCVSAISRFICHELERDAGEFELKSGPRNAFHVPYYTAAETGVLPERGVPDALPFLLSKDAPMIVRSFTRKLLISPPSFECAETFRQLNQEIATSRSPIGRIMPIDAGRLLRAFAENEVSPTLFVDLASTSQSLRLLPSKIFDLSVVLTSELFSLQSSSSYSTSLSHISSLIHEVVPAERADCDLHSKVTDLLAAFPDLFDDEIVDIERFFSLNEKQFRNRIHPHQCDIEYCNVKQKATELLFVVLEIASSRANQQGTVPKGTKKAARDVKISLDVHNETLNLKGRGELHGLKTATDRFGKPMTDRQTSVKLETSLSAYVDAVLAATEAVAKKLRDLSTTIHQSYRQQIEFCAEQSVIVQTAISHCEKAIASCWGMARLDPSRSLSLTGVMPYWLTPGKDNVVLNDVEIDKFVVLTGANAAGKSTLLRSTALCVILTHCGFYSPLRSGHMPHFGGVFLRTGAEDSPLEGLSSFANEMRDMASILAYRSEFPLFILADEVGKGTESSAGAAIASATLNEFIKLGHHGIFATHWLEIMNMPDLHFHSLAKFFCMEVETLPDGQQRPTWRIQPGVAKGSLAFETALRYGLPAHIVSEAREIQSRITSHWRHMPEIRPVSSPLLSSPITPETNDVGSEQQKHVHTREDTIQAVLAEAQSVLQIRGLDEVDPIEIPVGFQPPLTAVGRSCLYILVTLTGFFYVGESDDFKNRLLQHRSKDVCRKNATAYLFILPPDCNKGSSRDLESILITRLAAKGIPLLSDKDGQHSVRAVTVTPTPTIS